MSLTGCFGALHLVIDAADISSAVLKFKQLLVYLRWMIKPACKLELRKSTH